MKNHYKAPLAKIHDTHFGDLARNAALSLLEYVEQENCRGKHLLDLGCGSGITASILSEQDFKVTGVDISSEMLEIARARAPKATFIHSSLFDLEFPKSDIVVSIGEPINYLFDNQSSYEATERLFGKINACLTPQGLFLFDFLTNRVEISPKPRIMEKEDMTMFLDISLDEESSILTRKMTFFYRENDQYIKDVEIHQQYLFDEARISAQLRSLNFDLVRLDRYGDYVFRSGHVGYLCKKRG